MNVLFKKIKKRSFYRISLATLKDGNFVGIVFSDYVSLLVKKKKN